MSEQKPEEDRPPLETPPVCYDLSLVDTEQLWAALSERFEDMVVVAHRVTEMTADGKPCDGDMLVRCSGDFIRALGLLAHGTQFYSAISTQMALTALASEQRNGNETPDENREPG